MSACDGQDCKCTRCGALYHDAKDYGWAIDSSSGEPEYKRLCERCTVQTWYCNVQIVFHPGIPKEVQSRLKSFKVLKHLQSWFGTIKPIMMHVYHRRDSEKLPWQSMWTWDKKPRAPYSFRGFCTWDSGIVLLWDETETVDSIEWIMYHELAHHATNQTHMIDQSMDQENKNEGRTKYEAVEDAGHEADSEERLVNRVATAYMEGREYARPWWRPRVTAKLAGEPIPADPLLLKK